MKRRMVGGILFFGAMLAIAGLMWSGPDGKIALAADTKQEAALKKEVANLQAQINAMQQSHAQLKTQLETTKTSLTAAQQAQTQLKNQLDTAKTSLAAANQANKDKDALITTLKNANPKDTTTGSNNLLKQLQAMKNAAYVHVVVLKLKKDAPMEEVQAVLTDLPALAKISSVRGIWFGPPAVQATPDVAVNNYDVAITVLFDNFDGLKAYFADQIHLKFVEKHLKFWEPPVVFDYYLKPSP